MNWHTPNHDLTEGGHAQPIAHASIVRRGGVYETTLDGIRLGNLPNVLVALNRLAAESVRRGETIVAPVRDLNNRYFMQFNPDGSSHKVAPPVPPEAALGGSEYAGLLDRTPDLGTSPDGGADQEEWIADTVLGSDDPDETPAKRRWPWGHGRR